MISLPYTFDAFSDAVCIFDRKKNNCHLFRAFSYVTQLVENCELHACMVVTLSINVHLALDVICYCHTEK